jgi:superfamily II DNA or RNA helicase
MSDRFQAWREPASELTAHVVRETERTLEAYRTQPTLVREHVGIEANIFSGGYGRRQIFELIQNAADAIVVGGLPGRIAIVLTEAALYCANEGLPIDADGVTAILSAYLSQKRGAQIGHFGLGFKSVLNVSSTPQFFCRTGSFGFDLAASRDRIRAVLPEVDEVPVLRLAHLLDATTEAEQDPELAALMEWATTVVRLPRNQGDSSWLSGELAAFPSNFLIFSPHVKRVELIDRVAGSIRVIDVEEEDQIVVISEGDAASAWAVFRRELHTAALSHAEFDDCDRATRQRDVLPLIWAVPDTAGRSRGRFWAFFPTETETTLSGILNAPWKTNADRQNLLDGPFNRRILSEFVGIVRDAWADLVDLDDPGALLDLLPARAQDDKNWADGALSHGLYRELALTPSVPDGEGALVHPSAVLLRPDEGLSDGGRQWVVANPGAEGAQKRRWVHSSVETRERRPRAERLGCPKGHIGDWLVDVAASATPGSCKRALALVDLFWSSHVSSAVAIQVRNAPFVLTTTRALVSPDPRSICLPSKRNNPPAGMSMVHRAVANDSMSVAVLKRLGLKELGVEVQLDYEIRSESPRWDLLWELLRTLPHDAAVRFVRIEASRLKVRTCAGTFRSTRQALLPGRLTAEATSEDDEIVIDLQFHESDLGLLKAAGAVDGPQPGFGFDQIQAESWFADYVGAGRANYRRSERRGDDSGITICTHSVTVGPLYALVHGSPALKARIASSVAENLPAESRWSFHYHSRPRAYPTTPFPEPARWCLSEFGVFSTSLGPTPVVECVGAALSTWGHFLPVASVSQSVAADLAMPQSLDQFRDVHWAFAFTAAERIEGLERLEEVWSFYAQASACTLAPARVVAYSADQPTVCAPSAAQVCDDRERFAALQGAGVPSMLVASRREAESLISSWGCTEGVATVRFEATADPEPLFDVLPGLERYVTPAAVENLLLQPCARIWLEINEGGAVRQSEVPFAHSGGALCYCTDQPIERLFDRVVERLGVKLAPSQRSEALTYLDREQRISKLLTVREETTVAGKLLVALGGASVMRLLPQKVLEAAFQASPDRSSGSVAADAAVAVFGVELLKAYAAEFVEAGFNPPRQWTGGHRAAAFCAELGFPSEYAGFPTGRRDPMIEVDGPIELRPLHDFQQVIADRIRSFFVQPAGSRGLLSLPTGAGKTRVAVEALIGGMRSLQPRTLILWLGQTDELCEQAVQAWKQAWRTIGPSTRLRVSRLWGATNDLVRLTEDDHVVVCTYQSLATRLSRPDYEWLLGARAVVIDEAHGSTAPSYTEILHALGLTAQTTARHLIGLTATPFRGSGLDEEETRWLANRYGQKRFDQEAMPEEDPYAYLQARGILARVDHQVLEGGELSLSPGELEHLAQYHVLPSTAEQRLGDDDARNRALADAIVALDPSWPILVFATSVNHAQLMAALLSLRGVTSKAISGDTDPGARRHYISEFKAGRIRVLTNYGVLTTGFDAPAVRALVIARPVYSRGLYQQMIGRGLRGPRNGGKERCLIVNVADNVAQYGQQLAFRGFEHLWNPWAEPGSVDHVTGAGS